MSKELFALSALCALISAGGVGTASWGTVELAKEHQQTPALREPVKQDYENGNIDTAEYTVKMEDFAKADVAFPLMEGLLIVAAVGMAVSSGGWVYQSVEEAQDF